MPNSLKEEKSLFSTIEWEYGENDRKSRSSMYYHAGGISSPMTYTTYNYDKNFNLVSETTTLLVDYSGKAIAPMVSTTEYKNKDTLVMEEWKLGKDSLKVEHYSFKYDAHGNMVEKERLDKMVDLGIKLVTFKYNDSGKVSEDNSFFSNGEIFRRHKFIYNEVGDLITQLEYGDETDNPIVTVTYRYEVINGKKRN